MTKKEKLAKMIRIITVPPVLIMILLAILNTVSNHIFKSQSEVLLSVLLLVLVPAAAYPLQPLFPSLKEKGREGQRNLAFILNLAGYGIAVIYGAFSHVSSGLQLIYNTYFISVFVLVIFNKIIKLRASGHACSITGPLVFLIYFIGWKCIIPCCIVFLLVVWSSLTLKRHTIKDLTAGSIICLIAFLCSFLIMGL
ncbi:MAG TPA: hypothetical protein VN258_12630 [Mobilitalea sp.]|nr:hypothetical protein [Mobilitalea sp.]